MNVVTALFVVLSSRSRSSRCVTVFLFARDRQRFKFLPLGARPWREARRRRRRRLSFFFFWSFRFLCGSICIRNPGTVHDKSSVRREGNGNKKRKKRNLHFKLTQRRFDNKTYDWQNKAKSLSHPTRRLLCVCQCQWQFLISNWIGIQGRESVVLHLIETCQCGMDSVTTTTNRSFLLFRRGRGDCVCVCACTVGAVCLFGRAQLVSLGLSSKWKRGQVPSLIPPTQLLGDRWKERAAS